MILTPSPLADILIFCILGLIGIHTFKLHSKGRWLLLDPLNMFWAGVLVVYVMQPISHASTFIDWHPDGVFELTLFWTVFGLVFVLIGYEQPIGSFRDRIIPAMPYRFISTRFALGAYILIFMGIFGYMFQFASAGGAEKWLEVGRGGTDWDNVSGYMLATADLLPLGILMLLFHAELHPVSKAKRQIIWLLGFGMLLWFLYLGTRSRTISFSLVLLAAYYLPRRRNPPLWHAAFIFLMLFIIVNFQASFRGNFTNLSFNLNQINIEEAYRLSAPGFLGGNLETQAKDISKSIEFNCVMSVVELVPDRVDYNYGYGHLEIFTRIIPRALWPDKIYPSMESGQGVLREGGLTSATVRDTNLLMGPAFTFAGHWYYVGGAVGLMLGGLLTGAMLRLIRYIYDRSCGAEGDLILFTILSSVGFGEAAATPLGWIFNIPITLLPVLIIFYWSGERIPSNNSNLTILRRTSEEYTYIP